MKRYVLFVVLSIVLGLSASQASAVVVDLTFEGLQNLEPIANYYAGGTGGFGSGPGTNYGISFGNDSLAIISNSQGGTGNFGNNPSGRTIAFFLSGPGDVMNVPAGFDTGFSFYYAAAYAGSVTVFDDLNGTGNVLASLNLPVTSNPYYVWVPIGVTFAGTAKSVNFSGVADYIGFDDITLGSDTPGPGTVPEPLTMLGVFAGITGLGGYIRKRRMA